jgi:hypothetical protein
MLCPPHPPWLDNSNYTWRRVQFMKRNIPSHPFCISTLTHSLPNKFTYERIRATRRLMGSRNSSEGGMRRRILIQYNIRVWTGRFR